MTPISVNTANTCVKKTTTKNSGTKINMCMSANIQRPKHKNLTFTQSGMLTYTQRDTCTVKHVHRQRNTARHRLIHTLSDIFTEIHKVRYAHRQTHTYRQAQKRHTHTQTSSQTDTHTDMLRDTDRKKEEKKKKTNKQKRKKKRKKKKKEKIIRHMQTGMLADTCAIKHDLSHTHILKHMLTDRHTHIHAHRHRQN